MFRVWSISGEEVAAIPVEELTTVQALKKRLHSLCGVPRFRQRLLHNSVDLDEDSNLDSAMDVQLVLLSLFRESSGSLLDAVVEEDTCVVEKALHLPEDPDQSDVFWRTRPLLSACRRGAVDLVRLLLEAGADKNKTHGEGLGRPLKCLLFSLLALIRDPIY